MFRIHSNALMPFGVLAIEAGAAVPSTFLFTVSRATLVREPPVPLSAETTRPAVSETTSVSVALPLRYAAADSDNALVFACHRGSNQSVLLKSKMDPTRTKSRMLQ